jgi:hypothetical protein
MLIESSTAAVILTPTLPLTPFNEAVMFALPIESGVTTPRETLADCPFDEDHCAEAVMSCVLPSLKEPVAVRVAGTPRANESPLGPTVMLTKEAALTYRLAVPVIESRLADIVVEPATSEESMPAVPRVLLIVASSGLVTLQCTEVVTSRVLPSVSVAVAVNAWDSPAATVTEPGLIEIETIVAGVTLTLRLPEIAPRVAVTVLLPTPSPVTSPVTFTVATDGEEDIHETVAERSCVLPSL